jgi:co-chaperonin GroES (HSP10)
MKVICPFDRLVVRREGSEKISPGGIVIPDKVQSKHPPRRGTVVYAGDKCIYAKEGDFIVFKDSEKGTGEGAYYDGLVEDGKIVDYVFLQESDILVIQRETDGFVPSQFENITDDQKRP